MARVEEVAKSIIFLCSEKAKRITGHVLKVDGGKGLTSAGYIPWCGMDVMNRRFEPDFMTRVNIWMSEGKKKFTRSRETQGSAQWIKDVQTSNWAILNEDAHWKVLQEYKNEHINDDEVNHFMQMHQEGGTQNPKMARKNK